MSHKYRNEWDESNHNSHSYNIKHLIFEMVYHYYQWLPSKIKKLVYMITMLNRLISTFWWFVSNLEETFEKKRHKHSISNGYKYQCEQSSQNNTYWNK